jgi:hypothetical protein
MGVQYSTVEVKKEIPVKWLSSRARQVHIPYNE